MLTLLDALSLSRAPCKAHGEMGDGHEKREHEGMVQCSGPRPKPGGKGREAFTGRDTLRCHPRAGGDP